MFRRPVIVAGSRQLVVSRTALRPNEWSIAMVLQRSSRETFGTPLA
jgi:hypothetical protein